MAKQQPILDLLAKELGYKDGGDLKKRLKESHGDDFAGSFKSRLEEGQSIGQSFGGGLSDTKEGIKKALSSKNIKQKIMRGAIGGDNVLSAYVRGKLKSKNVSPTLANKNGEDVGDSASGGANPLITVIAKNSMSFPSMARDINVMRQNLQKLVTLKGGKKSTGADMYFLNSKQREEKLEVDRKKYEPKKIEPGAPKPTEEGGSFLSKIWDMLKTGLFEAAKFIFNPKNLLKVLGKLAVPLLIISTLFSGIMDGFKKYQESGSLSEAIVSGLGGMLSTLTFGLLGEDTLKQVFDSLSGVFKPVLDTVSNIFDSIKGFFKNIFGSTIDIKDEPSPKAKEVTPSLPNSKVGGPGGEADKAGGEVISKMTEMGVPEGTIPKDIFGDMGNVIDAGKSGGFGAMVAAGEELKKKYPTQQPESPNVSSAIAAAGGTSATTPTPVGKTVDTTSADYHAAAMGVARPPEQVSQVGKSAGTSLSQVEAKAESDKASALKFLKRSLGILPEKDGFSDLYSSPMRKMSEEEVRQKISEAGKDPDKILGLIKGSNKGGGSIDVSSGNLNQITGGAIGGGGGGGESGGSAGSVTPSPSAGPEPKTGESLSATSAQVAESQRMESAADQGSVINSPTTNNSTGSTGKPKKQTASAYDEDFAKRLATT